MDYFHYDPYTPTSYCVNRHWRGGRFGIRRAKCSDSAGYFPCRMVIQPEFLSRQMETD